MQSYPELFTVPHTTFFISNENCFSCLHCAGPIYVSQPNLSSHHFYFTTSHKNKYIYSETNFRIPACTFSNPSTSSPFRNFGSPLNTTPCQCHLLTTTPYDVLRTWARKHAQFATNRLLVYWFQRTKRTFSMSASHISPIQRSALPNTLNTISNSMPRRWSWRPRSVAWKSR